jgi:hypothetical protein
MARKAARERRVGGYRAERPKAAPKAAKAAAGARGSTGRGQKRVDRGVDPFGAFTEWSSKKDERAFGRL